MAAAAGARRRARRGRGAAQARPPRRGAVIAAPLGAIGGTAITVVLVAGAARGAGATVGATPAGILIVGMPMIVAERGGMRSRRAARQRRRAAGAFAAAGAAGSRRRLRRLQRRLDPAWRHRRPCRRSRSTFSSIVCVSHGLGRFASAPTCAPLRGVVRRAVADEDHDRHVGRARRRTSARGRGRSPILPGIAQSARTIGRLLALWPSRGPRRQLRAPTYVNSVPRNVMSATCCIVALSSTHKTILLTWVLPEAARRTRPTDDSSWYHGLAEGQTNCRESVGPFGDRARASVRAPCRRTTRHCTSRRPRPSRRAPASRHRPQGRGAAAPRARRSRGRLLRDRQGPQAQSPAAGRPGDRRGVRSRPSCSRARPPPARSSTSAANRAAAFRWLVDARAARPRCCPHDHGAGKTICIDYSSPNISKHLAYHHIRVDDDRPRARADLPRARLPRRRHQLPRRLGHHARHAASPRGRSGAPTRAARRHALNDLYVRFRDGDEGPTRRSSDEGRAWFKKLEDGDPEARALWQRFREVSWAEFEAIYELPRHHVRRGPRRERLRAGPAARDRRS